MTDPVKEELACFELGARELESGRFEQALEPLKRAMDLNQANGHAGLETEVGTVYLLLGLAKAFLESGRHHEAAFCFAEAAEAHREAGEKEAEMDALAGLGHSQMNAAEAADDSEGYAAAGSCFAGELALAVELEHVEAQTEALINGSHCFTAAGEHDDETVEYLEYTIAFLEQHREEVDDVEHHLARNRIRLGLCLNDRGEQANALAPLRLAEEGTRGLSGCSCHLRSLRGLVDALEELKDWPAFEQYIRMGIEHCRDADRSREVEFTGRLGIALAAQGDMAGGLREADRAIALANARFEADPSREDELGTALGIKATVLNNWVKRFATAVEPAERAVDIARRNSEEHLLMNRLVILGGIHANIGGQEALTVAAERLKEALELAENLGDDTTQATAHAQLGSVCVRLDDPTSAISHYESAIEIYRATGVYGELSSVLVSLAAVPGLPPGRAVACLNEARMISSRVVDPAAEAFALRELSRVRRAVGLHEEAREAQRLGLEIVESVRARLATSVERAALLEAHGALYADASHLAYERHEPFLALRYAEAGRGRLILDRRAEEADGHVPDPELRERRRAMAGEIGAHARELERLGTEWLGAGRPESDVDREKIEAETDRVEVELQRLEADWRAMEADLAAENPRFAARVPVGIDSIWSVSRIQERLLGDDSVLLEYLFSDDGCLLFCITGDDFEVFELAVGAEEAETMVDELCAALVGREGGYPHGHSLYRALIQPASDLIAGKSEVLIAPSGALHRLPFGALLREDPGAAGEDGKPFFADRWNELPYFLDDSRNLRFVASATTEGTLQQAEESDPIVYGSDLLVLSAPLDSTTEERGTGFPPLRSAREELEVVLTGLGGQSDARGSFARKDAVAKSDAVTLLGQAAYRFVHLITHGLLDDRSPWFSALVFEPEAGSVSPGFLHANEAVDLLIPAQCVTLSGCQTLGDVVSAGEGVLGLGLAFRYAGARAVCASRWSVADEVTTLLMRRFYENLQSDGGLPSAALARAQQSLIAESYHPFYWAAFGVFS